MLTLETLEKRSQSAMSKYQHEHKSFKEKKQWCPTPECRFHVAPQMCQFVDANGTECKAFTGIAKNGKRNAFCFDCFKYCSENEICLIPKCLQHTENGYPICGNCYKSQVKETRKSSGSWSELEDIDAPTNCLICGSEQIQEGKLPICQGCFTIIRKNDKDAHKYLWKGTCMGHKHPQVGNTVTCPVCNDNGDRFYTQMGRKCQQCSQWLSSKEDCSLCTAKHFKEFTKQTKPAEHKVYVQRLETATRPVTKDLAFNRVASFHTEPEPEPESESDSQEHEQEREVKVDPKNPPPIPKPEPQPKQEEPKQEEPKQELKKEEVKTDVNISVVVEQGKSLIKVVAFEKTALMQVDFIGFSMNQVNGKTFVTSNGQTFAVETDPVKKTIAFVF